MWLQLRAALILSRDDIRSYRASLAAARRQGGLFITASAILKPSPPNADIAIAFWAHNKILTRRMATGDKVLRLSAEALHKLRSDHEQFLEAYESEYCPEKVVCGGHCLCVS